MTSIHPSVPVHDGGSSDSSGQSYLPSQYSSNRMHWPVDLHTNSDMRQHTVGPTAQPIVSSNAAVNRAVSVLPAAAICRCVGRRVRRGREPSVCKTINYLCFIICFYENRPTQQNDESTYEFWNAPGERLRPWMGQDKTRWWGCHTSRNQT